MHRMTTGALVVIGIGFFASGFAASSSMLFMAGGVAWALVLGLVILARHRRREEAVMAALSEPPPPPKLILPAIPIAPVIRDNPFMTPLEDGVRSMFDLDWADDEVITAVR